MPLHAAVERQMIAGPAAVKAAFWPQNTQPKGEARAKSRGGSTWVED